MSFSYEDVIATAEASRDELSASAVVTIAIYPDQAFCAVSMDEESDEYSAHAAILNALEAAAEQVRLLMAKMKASHESLV